MGRFVDWLLWRLGWERKVDRRLREIRSCS